MVKLLTLVRKSPEEYVLKKKKIFFFDVKKRRPYSEVTSLRSFLATLFKKDAFRSYRELNKLIINQ